MNPSLTFSQEETSQDPSPNPPTDPTTEPGIAPQRDSSTSAQSYQTMEPGAAPPPTPTSNVSPTAQEVWTLEKVHRAAEKKSPNDPVRANFGTIQAPIPAPLMAMVVAVKEPPVVTFWLIGVMAGFFLLGTLLELLDPIPGMKPLVLLGANDPELVFQGQYFRILTACFLHVGIAHLMMNVFGLWILGRLCEPLFGRLRFLLLMAVAAMAGGLISALVRDVGLSVGASGAIFGLIAAIVVFPLRTGSVLPEAQRSRLLWQFLPWLVFSLWFTFTKPAVDIGNHLGGLAAGALTGLFMGSPVVNPWGIRHRGAIIVWTISVSAAVSWLLTTYIIWLGSIVF